MADTAVESAPVASESPEAPEVVATEAAVEKKTTAAEVDLDKSADLSASIATTKPEETPVAKEEIEILERIAATAENPLSETESAIIRQVEYYFSDANLARDKFLIGETKKDDGWVPFTVLLTFKRLLALSDDSNVIVDALIKSANDLLQISKDRTKLRRNPARPLPEQNEKTRQETIARTAYVKGFPLDTEMSVLIKFFDTFDNVTNVIMRRYQDKPTKEYRFKGSVFISFATREDCAKFLELENVEFDGGVALIRKWESDYYEAKKEERSSEKKKAKKEEENKINLPKGAVIHLDGLSAETTRESIKEAITALGGEVAFIDYNKGDQAGHVRLTTENAAEPVFAKFTDGKLKLDSIEATGRVLEGEEETTFLVKVVENMKSRRNQGNNRFKSGRAGGGGHNKFQNNRKRRGDRDNADEPSSKK